jgi:hypothetical protein
MLPRPSNLLAGFVPHCLPMKAPRPPSGALRAGEALQPSGQDLTDRFSSIVEALAGLRSRSCIIDGEAVACDERASRRSIVSDTAGMTTACFSMPST